MNEHEPIAAEELSNPIPHKFRIILGRGGVAVGCILQPPYSLSFQDIGAFHPIGTRLAPIEGGVAVRPDTVYCMIEFEDVKAVDVVLHNLTRIRAMLSGETTAEALLAEYLATEPCKGCGSINPDFHYLDCTRFFKPEPENSNG